MTSGPNAPAPDSWPMHTLNRPMPSPPSSPHWRPDAAEASCPGARVTSTTASSASRMPTTTSADGRPSSANPTVTGTTAARTPVVGATTPIRPTARPRYSEVMPITPKQPAATAQATSRALRERLAARDADAQRRDQADELHPEHDAEQRRAAAEELRRRSRPPPSWPPR